MVKSLKIPDPSITTNNQELNDWLRWVIKTLQQDFPYMQPYQFMQSNVAASQSAVALDVLGLSGNTEYTMELEGSVIGISIASNDARTAGILTADVTINGTATGLQAVLDGTNTTYHYVTQIPETDTFSAGDRLGVDITTDGSWAPETADIVVTVIVLK